MQRLESIKMEGGMPRDERRETLRALRRCPLQKIVLIGVCSPIGNTWGEHGVDLGEPLRPDEFDGLEAEDKNAVFHYGSQASMLLSSQEADRPFEATYGWPSGPPMLHIIASYAATVKELKFCGYKGSPVLFSPTSITTPMLSALKHFHSLESIIMSFWLNTLFEGDHRDNEVIAYWLNTRSPDSTAMVVVRDEEPEEGWEKELRTKYAPDGLAWRITSFIGPFLSEKAKSRKGGIHVRASFCVGEWGGIFDVDLWLGKGAVGSDVCLTFKGPREELEPDRRKQKLESRRWF